MPPTPPTNPDIVRAPLLYLYGVAPATHDEAFARVLLVVERWLADDDPVPDPEPDPPPPPCPKPPDPNPPPVPAYDVDAALEALAELDSANGGAWLVVRGALADWLTCGPFGD